MTTSLLHVCIKGWTATFRLPLLYSGTGRTSPVPPYSTVLGLLGCMAGRDMPPHEVGKIGYIFRSEGKAADLETTKRLSLNDKGELGPNLRKGDGISKREFHINPELHLYLENVQLEHVFREPKGIPTLGRSQDVCWTDSIKVVECEAVEQGSVRGTLVPFPTKGIAGLILLLPDWFDNTTEGYTRSIGRLSKYQVVSYESPTAVVRLSNLYQVMGGGETVYLRDFKQVR